QRCAGIVGQPNRNTEAATHVFYEGPGASAIASDDRDVLDRTVGGQTRELKTGLDTRAKTDDATGIAPGQEARGQRRGSAGPERGEVGPFHQGQRPPGRAVPQY